jgi:hypothetical protein
MISRLIIILILSIAFISCKKEADGDKIIDLTDANIRITRVEQLFPLKTPPFAGDGVYASEYILKNNDSISVNMFRGLTVPNEVRSPIIVSKEDNESFKVQFKGLSFGSIGADYNCGVDNSSIRTKEGLIQTIVDELLSARTFCIVDRTRVVEYFYQTDKISSIKTRIDCPLPSECDSVSFPSLNYTISEYDIKQWSGNNILQYTYYSYNEYFLSLQNLDLIFGRDIGMGKELTIDLRYKENNSFIPKMLLIKVNQLLSGVLAGPLDDFIHNWQIDFVSEANTFTFPYLNEDAKAYYRDLNANTNKTVLGDWIWSFSHPSLNVLPEQDKIISSKRIVGKKMVDIVDGEPVYQAVDSTASFPYTHDSVAKTLEIAGLKIWYEVVD